MRYPIGLQSFDHLREEGYVYVDKTAMVYSLAHLGRGSSSDRAACRSSGGRV